MLLTYWLTVVAIAGVCTLAYFYQPRERVIPTALGSAIGWAIAAIFGGDVEVASNGSLVAAPVPDPIRFFLTFWALLGILALLLYVAGVYPPTPAERTPTDGDVQ